MINRDKLQEGVSDSDKTKANSSLCYKCKKNNAIVYTREKSCKGCFLLLVEYTFKNTLREKCLFKSKIRKNVKAKPQIAEKEAKRNEGENYNGLDAVSEQVSDKHRVIDYEVVNSFKKKSNEEINLKRTEQNEKQVDPMGLQEEAIAFSGEICSTFLLFLFVKYLKNVKNRKNNFILTNEHCIFSEIIFVDIYQQENYIFNMISTIENIFRAVEENISREDVGKAGKVDHTDEEKMLVLESKNRPYWEHNVNFTNGVFQKKINKVLFTVLRINYFTKEDYKEKFLANYDVIKKEKSYYLNYINELIIYNNILKYCVNENIKYVLFGNNANNISNKSFLYTIFGNGINLPLCTAYIDNRYEDIKFIKPMKDLLNKEIYIYCYYKNITYLHNTTFDGNLLYGAINNILSNLDHKNNTTSIINNTTSSLINLMNYVKKEKGRNEEDQINAYENVEKRIDNRIHNMVNDQDISKNYNSHVVEKKYYSNYVAEEFQRNRIRIHELVTNGRKCSSCFVCLGNKEIPEEKDFIKRMDKVQLTNVKKMKCTNSICSACLSIFSSNANFANLFNVFF
ncbi:cytoplasmic tRNA 2-thiolation protein 2, putative [Plasmodium ovale]|uniref:Cytoplasmic tRNA 2-thiolation protein 2, putative n=1 Tax=Plasmodium ovale TaxID=36330 RepID=A0A1D3TLN0_PLAOA|nr:cytoplasmic tRNA 2-thiolation protein 2, putative [Plasmodium ovale]